MVYLQKLRLTPDVDNECLHVEMVIAGKGEKTVELGTSFSGKSTGEFRCRVSENSGRLLCSLKLSDLYLWDPDNPRLYDLAIRIRSESGCDEVRSYFGMRKLETDDRGFLLNGRRIFLRLVLDQGYYPEGIYTASGDESFQKDILLSRKIGFNGARLHEKVFERRYLYWADRLGYLVWGEYPNWGFDHSQESGLLYFLPEWMEALERDVNHPSVIGWCPMNENFDYYGKRQNFDLVKQIYLETKRFDPTRPCIDVSWNYHTLTDIYDVHDYTQDIEVFKKRFTKFEDGRVFDSFSQTYQGQPYFLSEFGGLKWPKNAQGWAYSSEEIDTEEDFARRFGEFIRVLYANPRICAFCYTQLYDVEQETNGLYYYDRSEKFRPETVRKMRDALDGACAYEKS